MTRADHDGRVTGELTQEQRRLFEDVFDLTADVGEELLHLELLGRSEDARGEVVNEVAIALIRGDPSSRRMGLGEVPLALESDHLAAHGRRRDPEVRVVRHGGGAHGLGGVDVFNHHGLEDRGLARVEVLVSTRFYRVLTATRRYAPS